MQHIVAKGENVTIINVMSETIGQVLKQLRETSGLSQRKLASISGVSRETINLLENDKRLGVSLKSAEALAHVFGVNASVFFTGIQPARSIDVILAEAQQAIGRMELVDIPLRGSVPAGFPLAVSEQQGEYVSIPRQLLNATPPEKVFALEISGDSLEGDGIYTGDTAIVDQAAVDIIDGKIYIVRIDTEVCARHVFKKNDHLRLKSSNGDYEDILARDVEILGRVILTGRWKKH